MIKFEVSSKLLSPTWWVLYIQDFASREPAHLAVEILCLAIILYLILSPTYNINEEKGLSKEEEDELIKEWAPEPLVPVGYADAVAAEEEPPLVVENVTGPIAQINGEEYLNLVSTNFLGLANRPEIKEAAAEIITRYGVGSCGPRGFYGTIDVHLQLEKTFANFMGTEDAILYSDGIACLSSVIPAFSKAGDLIVADEFVNFGIQQGIRLSRSKVHYFKHNDIASLEEELKKNDKAWSQEKKLKNRRFIVVEGIYAYTGQISPLKQIVELAKKYKFRVILDDTLAIGHLGKSGRGSYEHWGLTVNDVDLICANLDTTLSSVGGLCIGSKQAVSHQRLSGAGYCFSAASPPYTAKAATVTLGLIDANPALPAMLKTKTAPFYTSLKSAAEKVGFDVSGDVNSPMAHLRIAAKDAKEWGVDLKDAKAVRAVLKRVSHKLRDEHIIVGLSTYLPGESRAPSPSLKVCITALHADEDIKMIVKAIVDAAVAVRSEIKKCELDSIHA